MTAMLRRARRTNATASGFTTLRLTLLLPLVLALSLLGSAAQAQVDVTATAGTPGPTTYATLKLAFDAVNAGTHQGDITMAITANTVEGATPATLNSSGAGPALYTSVLIRPTADGVSISGNPASGFGVIQLNGADNVTIDGDNAGTGGTNRDLTIQNTAAATTTYASAIRVALSTLVTSANNVVVRNAIILGSAAGRNIAAATSTTGSEHTTYGILVGGGASTVAATTAPSAITSINTTIGGAITATGFTATNNQIDSCARGIAVQGSAVSVASGLVVTNNIIGSATAGNTTTVYSRGMTLQGFDAATISGNTIRNIESFIGTSTAGLSLGDVSASGTNSTVSNNVVTNVFNQSASTFGAYGININAGNAITVANNFVSGVNHVMSGGAAFSTTFGVFGIRAGTGINHKIYHNSVNLTGAHPGTPTTSLLSAALAVVGTGQTGLDIRNNSLQNNLTGGTTSIAHVGIYLPSGGTSAMNLTLNNNGYFYGSDAARQGVGQAGTTAGVNFFTSLGALKGYSSTLSAAGTNDNASFALTTAAPYTSATDLHIPAATATPLESGGAPVTVATDIDGDPRNGSTPDIGADEFVGIAVDLSPPSISYAALGNTTITTNRTLTTSITDPSGVPTAGVGLPVIYFRKGNLDPYASSTCVFVSGSAYDCTIDYALVTGGSVTTGDLVQYFVAAQDTANNVATNPSAGAGGLTANPPAAATPPTAPSSYTIAIALSGPLTVGTGGGYASLTNAGGLFQAINNNVLTGNLTIDILSDLAGETGANALNQWVEEGAGGYTLLLRPNGVARAVTGTSATGLIKLSGADRVTIDGSLAAGTDRSLTITNSGAGPIIWIATNATSGANNNTIKNCNLTGPGAFAGQGIIAGSGATLGNPAEFPNSNNTIQNNAIKSVQNAAFISGNAITLDQNWLVTENEVGSATVAEKLSFRGFLIGNAGNFTISRNVISGVSSSTSSSATMSGIQVANAIDGGSITGNRIGDIRQNNTAGWGSNGILLGASTTVSNVTISNNFISDIASQGFADVTALDNGYGIMITSGGGYRIVANSVLLNSNQVAAGGITAALNIAAAVTTPASIELRDNILASTQTIGTRYGVIDSSTAGAAIFSTIDHNDYFAQNVGFLTAAQATLADWQTATGQDASSLAVDPLFVTVPAPADLHLQGTSPMLDAGIALAAVTVDFDNDPRPAATPDIGADEVVQADLRITKTDGLSNVPPGGSTTYTIVATNLGAHDAPGATVTDVFPADLSCSTTCVGTLGGTCTAGPILTNINDTVNLPAGGVVTYTAVCTLSPSAVGILSNTATVAPPIGITDPVPGNDSATDNDTTFPEANVGITKTDGSATEVPGTSVIYTIVATNAGPNAAPSVTIVDNFPAALSGCSTTCAASGGSACTAGPVAGNINDVASLLVGGTATYTATCNISPTAIGALINTATATVGGAETDPATGNNTATDNDTLVPTADVTITKTNGVTQSTPGLPVTYTIVVTNAGPSAAPTVNVIDLFPATLTSCATTCVGAGGGVCTAGPVVGNVNENANLPVGGSATYTASCTLSLSATGNLVNTATATVGGGATDPNTADNSATDTDTIGNTIFNDGFESGDTLLWSATVPLTVEGYAVVGVASSEAAFGYDFSAVKSGEELMATAIAVVTDATGQPLFILGARRTEAFGELELTLQFSGAGESRWVPVSEVGQQVRIEWSLADVGALGHAAVELDGLVVLRLEGYAGTVTPAGVKLLRGSAPVEP